MPQIRQGLPHRLFWFTLAAAACFSSVTDAISQSSWAYAATALGWAMLSVLWFMTPVVLSARLSQLLPESGRLALGPTNVRMSLGVGGMSLLLIGLIFRVWNGA